MKQPFTKREIVIIAISLLLITVAGIRITSLQQAQTTKNDLIESQSKSLREKDAATNQTTNYVETICAEYRKLYQSYREARYPNPENVDKYAGLPGSAKGWIDDCYLPD